MANKAQLIQRLATASGLTIQQATAAVNALPEAFGDWLKNDGPNGPGSYKGEADGGLSFEMTRSMSPTPHWSVKISLTDVGLADFGDSPVRFGLPVQNA